MEEGVGVIVKRLMPIAGFKNFDPFVLWGDFLFSSGNGFSDHPLHGFEEITYLFNGSIEHKDNLGNQPTVLGGGIQLWINLPKRLKQTPPTYQQVNDHDFPIKNIEGGTIKTIVGKYSSLQLVTPVCYLDVQLEQGTMFSETFTSKFNPRD